MTSRGFKDDIHAFNDDRDAELVCILSDAMHRSVEFINRVVHQQHFHELLFSVDVFAERPSSINECFGSSGGVVVYSSGVVQDCEDDFRTAQLAASAPNAVENGTAHSCGQVGRRS